MTLKRPISQSADGNNPIEVIVQARLHTPTGETYQYLMRDSRWSAQEGEAMLGQAAQDYWLAYARQSADPSLAKTTALACIERIEYQIAKLRRDFQLELSPMPSSPDWADPEAAISELLAEISQIPQPLNTMSNSLTNLETSDFLRALDVFLRENPSFLENLAEDLSSD